MGFFFPLAFPGTDRADHFRVIAPPPRQIDVAEEGQDHGVPLQALRLLHRHQLDLGALRALPFRAGPVDAEEKVAPEIAQRPFRLLRLVGPQQEPVEAAHSRRTVRQRGEPFPEPGPPAPENDGIGQGEGFGLGADRMPFGQELLDRAGRFLERMEPERTHLFNPVAGAEPVNEIVRDAVEFAQDARDLELVVRFELEGEKGGEPEIFGLLGLGPVEMEDARDARLFQRMVKGVEPFPRRAEDGDFVPAPGMEAGGAEFAEPRGKPAGFPRRLHRVIADGGRTDPAGHAAGGIVGRRLERDEGGLSRAAGQDVAEAVIDEGGDAGAAAEGLGKGEGRSVIRRADRLVIAPIGSDGRPVAVDRLLGVADHDEMTGQGAFPAAGPRKGSAAGRAAQFGQQLELKRIGILGLVEQDVEFLAEEAGADFRIPEEAMGQHDLVAEEKSSGPDPEFLKGGRLGDGRMERGAQQDVGPRTEAFGPALGQLLSARPVVSRDGNEGSVRAVPARGEFLPMTAPAFDCGPRLGIGTGKTLQRLRIELQRGQFCFQFRLILPLCRFGPIDGFSRKLPGEGGDVASRDHAMDRRHPGGGFGSFGPCEIAEKGGIVFVLRRERRAAAEPGAVFPDQAETETMDRPDEHPGKPLPEQPAGGGRPGLHPQQMFPQPLAHFVGGPMGIGDDHQLAEDFGALPGDPATRPTSAVVLPVPAAACTEKLVSSSSRKTLPVGRHGPGLRDLAFGFGDPGFQVVDQAADRLAIIALPAPAPSRCAGPPGRPPIGRPRRG